MNETVVKIIISTIMKLFIDLPFALLVIRLWVLAGMFDLFKFPRPSWPQSWGIAALIVSIAPH